MFFILSRIERLVLENNYTWLFRVFVYLEFIDFNTYLLSVEDNNTRIVEFYYRRWHPFFLLFVVLYLPLICIPIIGVYWYIKVLVNIPDRNYPAKDTINMSNRNRREKKFKALRRSFLFDEVENDEEIREFERRLEGKRRKREIEQSLTFADDEFLEEYYSKKYSSYSETKETKPNTTVDSWDISKLDNSIDDEISEEEIRITNLYESLQKGYIKSVERFFKKKCNIYQTDYGYALERISRDCTKIYLDINLPYAKTWVGDDKVELLKGLIRELESGDLQRSTRLQLIDILDRFNEDISKIPNEKMEYLYKEYRIGCIPEDLDLKRAIKK